jgi:hypothetical protein
METVDRPGSATGKRTWDDHVQIEFLYEPDCESHEDALARLREVIEEFNCSADIVVEAVTNREQMQERRFLGSPTIRINGSDIDAASEARRDYALTCRMYVKSDGRISPLPPREMIRDALTRARNDVLANRIHP